MLYLINHYFILLIQQNQDFITLFLAPKARNTTKNIFNQAINSYSFTFYFFQNRINTLYERRKNKYKVSSTISSQDIPLESLI